MVRENHHHAEPPKTVLRPGFPTKEPIFLGDSRSVLIPHSQQQGEPFLQPTNVLPIVVFKFLQAILLKERTQLYSATTRGTNQPKQASPHPITFIRSLIRQTFTSGSLKLGKLPAAKAVLQKAGPLPRSLPEARMEPGGWASLRGLSSLPSHPQVPAICNAA